MKILGKLFFPKSPPHQQLKNAREMAVAVIIGVLVSAVIGVVIIFTNRHAH